MLANKAGISKRYLALLHGAWPASVTDVKEPLLRVERQSGERMVIVSEEGTAPHTRLKLLATGPEHSLLQAHPVTGRTHQLRVPCHCQGHPIVADEKYCDKLQQDIDRRAGYRRLCLHAYQLSFRHPATGDVLNLTARPDSEFIAMLAKAGCSVEL